MYLIGEFYLSSFSEVFLFFLAFEVFFFFDFLMFSFWS